MDFYKNVLNVIYQDALKVKNGYMNSIFQSENGQDPKFVGKAWHAHQMYELLTAIGQWCAKYEDSPAAMPTSFLPEFNDFIKAIMHPDVDQKQDQDQSGDEVHV